MNHLFYESSFLWCDIYKSDPTFLAQKQRDEYYTDIHTKKMFEFRVSMPTIKAYIIDITD